MEIVTAHKSHIPEIINAWEEFSRFHEKIDPRYPMVDNARVGYEEYLRKFLIDKDSRVLVAIDKGKLVGYAVAQIRKSSPAWKRKEYGYIEEMAVRAEHRRKGVGTQILEKILDWFRSENIDMIELTVAAKNLVGYSFWKKHGFKDYLHHLYLKS